MFDCLSKLVEMSNGARALARFTGRSERTVEMPGLLSFRIAASIPWVECTHYFGEPLQIVVFVLPRGEHRAAYSLDTFG